VGQGDLLREYGGLSPASSGDADPPLMPPAVRRRASAARSTHRLRALPQDQSASDLISIRDARMGFGDLLLPESTRRLFGEVHLEIRKEDFLVHHGVSPRRRFLLVGPPGTGKSATAEALADELGRPLATVQLSSLVSSLLGDTARNLATIFAIASREKLVVLFDEFDAIGKERSERSDHGELRRVVTTFLQQIDEFVGPSVLVATTNHPALLDVAAWRRFDEVIAYDLPNVHEIRALLRLKLRSIRRERGLDVDAVASACRGLTHADVSGIVTSAYRRHLLFQPDSPLTTKELQMAADLAINRAAAAHASS
jgi:ATP-dependent 26S proteasome regulatory subunit